MPALVVPADGGHDERGDLGLLLLLLLVALGGLRGAVLARVGGVRGHGAAARAEDVGEDDVGGGDGPVGVDGLGDGGVGHVCGGWGCGGDGVVGYGCGGDGWWRCKCDDESLQGYRSFGDLVVVVAVCEVKRSACCR